MDGRIDWEGLIVRPFLFHTRTTIWAKERVSKTGTLGDELMACSRKLDNMTSSVDEGCEREGLGGYNTEVGDAEWQRTPASLEVAMDVSSRLLSKTRLFASYDDEMGGCLIALTATKANEGTSWLQDTLDAGDDIV